MSTALRDLDTYKLTVDTQNFDYAVYEQALSHLQGDQRMILQQAGVTSFSLGKTTETFRRGSRDPNICPKAWFFLKGPSCKVGGLR